MGASPPTAAIETMGIVEDGSCPGTIEDHSICQTGIWKEICTLLISGCRTSSCRATKVVPPKPSTTSWSHLTRLISCIDVRKFRIIWSCIVCEQKYMKLTIETYNVWNWSARSITQWQVNLLMEVYAWLLSHKIVDKHTTTATTATMTATTKHLTVFTLSKYV